MSEIRPKSRVGTALTFPGPGEAEGPRSPVAPGVVIAERYLVGALIGEGGMGVVCEATHIALGLPVAIKLIRPGFAQNHEFVQRFLNEARRAALLKSEHVARVHDVGQLDSGEPYLVMERLEGIALDTYLRNAGPLLASDAVALVLQVCDGLAEAHAQGIVHRDIKPGNLFLSHLPNGRISVRILDFGISKQLHDDAPSTLTNRDRSLGSPWYMSPEQMMDSSTVDHRSDVWSLGVVLYELLTNERPFDGATVPEVCAKVLTGAAPSVRNGVSDVEPALEAVVFRCLAKDSNDRYQDVLELAEALRAAVPATRESRGQRAWQPEGELFMPARAVLPDAGSVAPLATTRRLGVGAREHRARPWGLLGVAAALLLTAGAFAKTWFDFPPAPLRVLAWPGTPALAPGPEPLPLDRDRIPFGLAVPSPISVEPLEPAPHSGAAASPDLAPSAALDPAEPSAAAPGSPAPRAFAHRRRAPEEPELEDNPYLEPSSGHASSSLLELRAALGRVREESLRSLELNGGESRESTDSERAASPGVEEKPAREPARDTGNPSVDARNRYGL